MAIISVTYITPVLLLFYKYLEKVKVGGNLGKLFVDQFIFSPIFTSTIIFFRLLLLKPSSPWILLEDTIKIAPTAVKSAWLFWIPARFFTINFVPPMYQLIFGNIFSYAWNIIFSLLLKG
jgi:hypothetical protein